MVLCTQVRFFVLDEADRLMDNEDTIMKLFKRMPKGGAGLARLQVGEAELHAEHMCVYLLYTSVRQVCETELHAEYMYYADQGPVS